VVLRGVAVGQCHQIRGPGFINQVNIALVKDVFSEGSPGYRVRVSSITPGAFGWFENTGVRLSAWPVRAFQVRSVFVGFIPV
jgi:hypothetical protein